MDGYQEKLDKLIVHAGTLKRARSAYCFYIYVKNYGWEETRADYSKTTFYRLRGILISSGLYQELPKYKRPRG